MIKRLYPSKGQDVIFTVEYEDNIQDFSLTFQTDNSGHTFTKYKSDLTEDNLLKLNCDELVALGNGILRCYARIKSADADFPDTTYDDVQFIQTDYYLFN